MNILVRGKNTLNNRADEVQLFSYPLLPSCPCRTPVREGQSGPRRMGRATSASCPCRREAACTAQPLNLVPSETSTYERPEDNNARRCLRVPHRVVSDPGPDCRPVDNGGVAGCRPRPLVTERRSRPRAAGIVSGRQCSRLDTTLSLQVPRLDLRMQAQPSYRRSERFYRRNCRYTFSGVRRSVTVPASNVSRDGL